MIKELSIDPNIITINGDSELYYLAIWKKDGYSYSIRSSNGLLETELFEMLKEVVEK